MGENVIHKLGSLDLSWTTVVKLFVLAVLVFLLIAAGRWGASKVQSGVKSASGKVKELVPGGSTPNTTKADPRYAGV